MSHSVPQLITHPLGNVQAELDLANLAFQPIQQQNQGEQPPIQNEFLNIAAPINAPQQPEVQQQIQQMPENPQQAFMQAFQALPDQAPMQDNENQQPGAPLAGQQPPHNPFAW
jgi:hypothetical protein